MVDSQAVVTEQNLPAVVVIGAGRVGTSLGVALKENGYPVIGVSSRTLDSARRAAQRIGTRVFPDPVECSQKGELVFITTPDRVISRVANDIAAGGGFKPGQVVVHTSGACSSQELASAREKGALAISLHPLQTFATVETGLKNLPGTYFTAEGDQEAMPLARQVVKDLGGKFLCIATEMKPLYHAAACVVCNYFVSLVNLGLEMMQTAGVAPEQALPAIMPLLQGTVQNLQQVGTPAALTGPIARGDAPTIASHLQVMKHSLPERESLYRHIGMYTVEVAEAAGLGKKEASTLLQVLKPNALGGALWPK